MAENKTKPTDASIANYIASRANEQQRADCKALMAILRRVTRQRPKVWGPSIVGYGSCHYTCGSGRSGDYGTDELPAMIASSRDFHVYRAQAHLSGSLIPVGNTNHFTILDQLRLPDSSLTRAVLQLAET